MGTGCAVPSRVTRRIYATWCTGADVTARPHFFIPPIYAEVTEEGRAQAFNNHHLD